jgi:hypothetical protein
VVHFDNKGGRNRFIEKYETGGEGHRRVRSRERQIWGGAIDVGEE